tara:strand:+ start:1345 stop:2079 length:735 start_codon:yes stop_codon:yes gene_type:complete
MILTVFFIIIVTIFILLIKRPVKYSWEDFSKKFGNCTGEFGVYDLTKKTEECTYVDKKITNKYDTIFKTCKTDNITYMAKIASSAASGCEVDILNYVKPISDNYEFDNLIIRIQTNPWRYAPHFDAMNQVAYMLSGTKRWLLWNIDFNDNEEAITFRDDVNNLNFEQLQTYLKNKKIPYETKIMKPHDSLYIKYGTWHYVENVNTTRGCIMLNLHLKNWSNEIDEKFAKLWPTQHKRCGNNEYY